MESSHEGACLPQLWQKRSSAIQMLVKVQPRPASTTLKYQPCSDNLYLFPNGIDSPYTNFHLKPRTQRTSIAGDAPMTA